MLDTVLEGATAVGVPARAVVRKDQKPQVQDLDQVHIPDPVSQELCRLRAELEMLKTQLNTNKEKKEQ